ncbi:MAG: sigma 54-interacting transcriptional regulator [Chromatiales bacterium]
MTYPLGYWEPIKELILEVAQERSVDALLHRVVDGIMANRSAVPLSGVWLCQPAADPDNRDARQGTYLCLAVMASRALNGYEDPATAVRRQYTRVDHDDHFIGRAAKLREAVQYPTPEQWRERPDWARRAGIVGGGAHPILFKGELLGVLAVCVSESYAGKQHESRFWLRMLADQMAAAIANAHASSEIEALRRQLKPDFREQLEKPRAPQPARMVGVSPAMRRTMEQVDLVAPTETSVLILGESGTGKELVARAIHERSARRARPLTCVNCAAVPVDLFESEFFGHVRGAFTGALRERVGRFEQADGGTLFLDEVSELPLAMQGKLLRVLQDREFERVGSSVTRRVSVRIIAATNRDLKADVQAGRFREDLYYRLNVFPLDLPPLRERAEDIPHLAAHFVNLLSGRLQRRSARLTESGIRALQSHHWPGNVRELQNVIERALILCGSDSLHFDISRVDRVTRLPPRDKQAEATVSAVVLTEKEQRQQHRGNILAALQATGGRVFGKGGAAELLGLKPTTLSSRMKALGIEKPPSMPRASGVGVGANSSVRRGISG